MKRKLYVLLIPVLVFALFLCGCANVRPAQEEPEPEEAPKPIVFQDVHEDDWFHEAVVYCCENGMMNGVAEGWFDPQAPMTRAMLVTVLWRAAGEPESISAGFADVPRGAWYTAAVNWASEKSIVNGVGDNVFAPDSPITREQTAAILYRWSLLGESGVHAHATADDPEALFAQFKDAAQVSPWAQKAMEWALANEIITGVPGASDNELPSLCPGDGTSRAQLCMILMRLLEK